MKLKLFKNKKGFTFIELILGMGIVVFLSAAMFQIISVSNTQQGLNNNTEKVKALLRLAQSYSLSIPQDEVEPKHICGLGIYGT
jgi:prepilin-type N-terminal cleavage/methylation domain-containing protein